jgi:hypothetical protein
VAGKNLVERSGTNGAHALHARDDAPLQALLDRVSVRGDHRHAIFGGLGTAGCRAALQAFAERDDHVRGSVELYLPTLLHHLGFRPADHTRLGHEYDHVRFSPTYGVDEVLALRAAGALAVHPA